MDRLTPMNLPLLINDPRRSAVDAVAKVLEGDFDTAHQMDLLSPYYKIKVWFTRPFYLKTVRSSKIIEKSEDGQWKTRQWRSGLETDCHIFNKITWYNGMLLYSITSNSRTGYHFPPFDCIAKWEPVPYKPTRR